LQVSGGGPKKEAILFSFKTNWLLVHSQAKERSTALKNIKSKRAGKVNSETLIVSVDVGKDKNTGYYRRVDGADVKPFAFANRREGFDVFWERIDRARKAFDLKHIMVGIESTGPYGEPLVHYFRGKPVQLVQVNPMHTKRLKELCDNSPNKTDKKDPRVIADIMQLGHVLGVVIPEGAAAELRRLTQARERSVERRKAVQNQLQQLVFVLFPEFVQVMKGIRSKTALYLLRHYPTSQAIIGCGLDRLSREIRRVSSGRLGADRARALYEAAQHTSGIQAGAESVLLEIRQALALLETLEVFIRELEQQMSRYLKQIPYSGLMLSVKGVGLVTAAGLIGEVGDFRKFRTIGELTKLAGLDLFEISSGKHQGQRRISKRGRPLMRKLLYLAALNTVREGGILHGHYCRCLERGMPKLKALVAMSRRLLRLLFAIVRDDQEYNRDYVKLKGGLKEAA
jgi:transposase